MKHVIILAAMALFFSCAYSQSTLSFCASVDQNGFCFFNNNKFFLSPDSVQGRIVMEVKNAGTFTGVSKITYNIYSVAKNGDEALEGSVDQAVQDTWVYAWLPHFFKEGKYNIKVFNDKEQMICSHAFELFNNK
jgi:hypothetical protein